jgi:DNA polymerase-3 subunit epsilon
MHSHRALDDWSSKFNLHNENRHNAVADALVTAQLLLVAANIARQDSDFSYDDLRSLERSYRYATGKGGS